MRILFSWLRALCDSGLSPEQVAALLTGAGLEVEGLTHLGRDLRGVVVAEIRERRPHPNADRLTVCEVFDGQHTLTVVCGAPNAAAGLKVPLAHEGAVLPGGKAIARASVRGVESHGMLCSARELGLSEEAAGLMVLPADAAVGQPLAAHLGLDDTVLELNATPNRPDWLSHLGVARELAAITGAPLGTVPILPLGTVPISPFEMGTVPFSVRIEAGDRCARYASYVIEGIRIGPSPAWLRQRLEACGVRAICNVVDATNYVLLELGHPLHAFDLDRLAGSAIVVRAARPGETLTTLDGKERALDPDDLVIADAERAQALAGVMGGGESEVGERTTRLLLESAWFLPQSVRRTARRHGLHTEASHRFERGADYEMVPRALDRLAQLCLELAGGEIAGGRIDVIAAPRPRGRVRLDWDKVGALLGVDVPRAETERWLGRLGLAQVDSDARGAVWEVPSARLDLTQDVDLVEEVARLRGYETVPATLPAGLATGSGGVRERRFDDTVRRALAAAGFSEAMSYSFIDPADAGALDPETPPVPISNPLASDQSVLRTSLLPGLIRSVVRNQSRGVSDVRLFECGTVFFPGGAGRPREELRIAGVLAGRRHPLSWGWREEPADLFDLKGAVEELCAAVGVEPTFAAPPAGSTLFHNACQVLAGAVRLGQLGELHPRVAERFGLGRGIFVFELVRAPLLAAAREVRAFQGLPRFPAVHRDVAVVVQEELRVDDLRREIRAIAGELAEEVILFDVYRGPQVPAGKKSMAFRIRYRAPDRTLTDEEASAAHARIVERIKAAFGGELRA